MRLANLCFKSDFEEKENYVFLNILFIKLKDTYKYYWNQQIKVLLESNNMPKVGGKRKKTKTHKESDEEENGQKVPKSNYYFVMQLIN